MSCILPALHSLHQVQPGSQCSGRAGAQKAPDQEIDFISEPMQRAEFDDSAFTAPFMLSVQTPAFKVSAHTLDDDPFLGTLPNEGQSQGLFELAVRALYCGKPCVGHTSVRSQSLHERVAA